MVHKNLENWLDFSRAPAKTYQLIVLGFCPNSLRSDNVNEALVPDENDISFASKTSFNSS